MNNFSDVRLRVFNFAIDVVKFCRRLPKDDANRVMIHQVLRSATSIGANIEEAIGAHTRSDFAYTMNIAKKEARESFYWLKLIHETNSDEVKNYVKPIINESEELLRILTTTVRNTINKGKSK